IEWTHDGDGDFDDATQLEAEYSPGTGDIANGSVILTLTATGIDPCSGTASDKIELIIDQIPIAYAGTSTNICATGSYKTTDATASYGDDVLWTVVEGGFGTFIDATNLNEAIYTPSAAAIVNGSATLRLTVSDDRLTCNGSGEDEIIITFTKEPVISITTPSLTTWCEGTPYQVDASSGTTGAGEVLWTTPGTGTLTNATSLTPIYTPNAADAASGSVTLTFTADAISPCESSATEDITFLVAGTPTVDVGSMTSICEGLNVIQGASVENYSSLFWTIILGNGELTYRDRINPIYETHNDDITTGTVMIELTVVPNAPCTDSVRRYVSLKVKAAPTASLGNNDTTICENEILQIPTGYANASNFSRIYWISSGDGRFSDSGLSPTYVPGKDDLIKGYADLTIHAENPPCTEATDNIILWFSDLPLVDAGSDATVDDGASFTVHDANVSDASPFFWTTSGTGTFDESGKDTIYDVIDPTYTPSETDFSNGGVQLTLTAIPTGSCTTPVTDYMFLRVEDHPPVDFTWASSCKGTDTEFLIDTDVTNVSTIASYVWDFGDG
ncbi:MAG: hypothetical protein GY855_06965, partial [candidate division Zixibacteria bacterium]|nr:hypothetical protein [candidate division Zixibacteria bacterium]